LLAKRWVLLRDKTDTLRSVARYPVAIQADPGVRSREVLPVLKCTVTVAEVAASILGEQ